MDLFQTIRENLAALYDIKGLQTRLKKPKPPNSIVSFILDFEPFLEQTIQNVRLKERFASMLVR